MPRNSTMLKLAGTKFFRLSSTMIWETYGSNLQNIEKLQRAIYIADGYDYANESVCIKLYEWLEAKDYSNLSGFTADELDKLRIMVQTDQSGAEARVVAYCCRPGKYRELFVYGVKPHVFVALHNFGEQFKAKNPEMAFILDTCANTAIANLNSVDGWLDLDRLIKDSDNWRAEERYYFIAKMICHSSNYDIKAPTFQLNVLSKSNGKIVLTRQQAELSLLNYHSLFPEIRHWHTLCREHVMSSGMIYNCLGYPITFTSRIDESSMKDVYAAGPQSTVGCITHVAYIKIQRHIEKNHLRWDNLNNNHDSILTQCPLQDVMEVVAVHKDAFNSVELSSPYNGDKFRMESESSIGFNWGPAKKLKDKSKLVSGSVIDKYNLLGLREVKA